MNGPNGWDAQLPGAVQAVVVRTGSPARPAANMGFMDAKNVQKQYKRARDGRDAFVRHFGLEQADVPLLLYDQTDPDGAPFSPMPGEGQDQESGSGLANSTVRTVP